MKVLVLGASGLLGHAMLRILGATPGWSVRGAMRNVAARDALAPPVAKQVILCGDLEDSASLTELFGVARPDVVINCLSIAKKHLRDEEFRTVISRLSVLPQRIAHECRLAGARLIHFSSDGVFSGSRGNYSEDDTPDASDVYGVAKLLGEVRDAGAISIRTSMIGHELGSSSGLLEWFLAQQKSATCFRRVIFSGLPSTELAKIVRDVVIPKESLCGVYHVAAEPISKYDLLCLVARVYGKSITIEPDDRVAIDRSLDAGRFARDTGYRPPPWPKLVTEMHDDHRHQAGRTA